MSAKASSKCLFFCCCSYCRFLQSRLSPDVIKSQRLQKQTCHQRWSNQGQIHRLESRTAERNRGNSGYIDGVSRKQDAAFSCLWNSHMANMGFRLFFRVKGGADAHIVVSLATTLQTHIDSTTLVNNKPHKSVPCPEDLPNVPQCPTHRKAKQFCTILYTE